MVAITFAVRQECRVPPFFSLMEQELVRLPQASEPGPLLGESQNNSSTQNWLPSPENHLNFNTEWVLALQEFARTPSKHSFAFGTDRAVIMMDFDWQLSEMRLDHSICSGESLRPAALSLIW